MFVILLLSFILYIVAIMITHTNTYQLKKESKIKFMAIGILVILVITTVIVWISSSKIALENKEQKQIAENTAILLFAPINSILFLPYIGNLLNQWQQKKLSKQQMKKRIYIISGIAVVMLLFELGYIKNFELGLLKSVM